MLSDEAKDLSTRLYGAAPILRGWIGARFASATAGCTMEVEFIDRLIQSISGSAPTSAVPAGFSCRARSIHARPIVRMIPGGRCELGDLVVVVKYHLLDGTVEKKTIIYQVKMTNRRRSHCSISAKQLRLLTTWPPFEFGRRRDGGPRRYRVKPRTAEFGSYMLELRDPRSTSKSVTYGPVAVGRSQEVNMQTFGVSPTAWHVKQAGARSVPFPLKQAASDVDAWVSHICFQIGEHHATSGVEDLISALYRYVGLDPDPPEEFHGYLRENEEPQGFGVVEINVEQPLPDVEGRPTTT